MGAMKEGSKDRYFQNNIEESKLVPEGLKVECRSKDHWQKWSISL